MKPYTWRPTQTLEEQKNGAYWERNMLALYFACYANKSWKSYIALLEVDGGDTSKLPQDLPCGWYHHGEYEGWTRVISLFDGRITFHVPDDFDLGSLPQIDPNWDGHTTEEKWVRMMKKCGVEL
jgi:hypothetical protein